MGRGTSLKETDWPIIEALLSAKLTKDELEMQLAALARSDFISKEFQLLLAATSCFRWPSITRLVMFVNTVFLDCLLRSERSMKLRLEVCGRLAAVYYYPTPKLI